ncbi:PLP-dependent aminotransferase family protein [Deinococcus ficus]|uniref:GntR family transcriptional regulator n=1 Tax=Deinococcus ficus TaxID=317577 RepID=A0A221SWK4_9DEIO|nr:PLP-dependent aminotransferase family protein [Deinococcus ficus]ASN81023.1 GntR family transcriptional regulator [Deinococcus ficus]
MARKEAPLSDETGGPLLDLPVSLTLDRTGPALHAQLARQLRAHVLGGRLPAGFRLPGTRPLAAALGVTRGVVAEAYAALVADGTLEAVVGSGTRVPAGAAQSPAPRAARTPGWFQAAPPAPVSTFRPEAGIFFQHGVTTGLTLDARAWRQAWAHGAARSLTGEYGDVQGEPDFRAALAAFAGRSRGLTAGAEDVTVISGTLQGLNLIARGVLPPASTVLFEHPGYQAARQVFLDAGHTVLPLKVDEDGPVVTPDLPAARLVYVTPSHQFPLGVRMSLPRRLALLEWAARHDALIVEDDYDSEFRYGAPPLPPLAGLDVGGHRVLYLGTLSKVLTPGVRVGFVIAPPAIRAALVRERTLLDAGSPLPVQHALTWLLTHGELDRHIRRSRRWHAQVREALTRELAGLEPHARLGGIEAGLHVCLRLSPALHAGEVQQDLARRGVHVSTLDAFMPGDTPPNALLLGHGGLTATQAAGGARTIRDVIVARAPGR